METKEKIIPHKITKPIQLLAAWLSGLVIVNASFLTAATQITNPSWLTATLVIASIVNVPLFLVSIFLLQTKFRPEMQEDTFYAKYLESKLGFTEREINIDSYTELREKIGSFEIMINERFGEGLNQIEQQKIMWTTVTIALNKKLKIFDEIAKKLTEKNIPVHEIFGKRDLSLNPSLKIALGDGFEVEQIKKIVEALSFIKDAWICYAHDETQEDEYKGIVLIGAYGSYEHGIKLDQVKPIIDRQGITITELYKVLGK